jgi:hypothetical protein
MNLSTARLVCVSIGVLGIASLLSMSTDEINAAPRGGGGGGGFRPMMPMHTPATGFQPSGVHPGTMPHGTTFQPSQFGNNAIQANSRNTMINSRIAVNTGFNGFGNFNGFGRMSTFATGLGAFNSGFGGFSGTGVSGFGFSGVGGGFNGSNGLFLNGFNNLNGFNSFGPSKQLGFSGANGL